MLFLNIIIRFTLKVKRINLVCLQILTVGLYKSRRLLYIMKATGIVRRIEARVIITQKSLKAA